MTIIQAGRVVWAGRAAAVAAVWAVLALTGCGRGDGYSQDSPDDVIKTARLMVEKGDARRLPDLIYAETPEMRAILDQFGGLLESVQDLAVTIEQKFPAEVAKVKAAAEEAAKKGEASSFLSRMARGMGAGGGGSGGVQLQLGANGPELRQGGERRRRRGGDGGSGQPRQDPSEMLNQMAREFFIDPYGWISAQNEKLTTTPIADDMAVVNWDGQPAFAGLFTMKKVKGEWYVVLPTNLPGVSGVMPRNREEFEVFGALIDVFDNAVKDVSKDVKTGRAQSIDDVARSAGEKAFIPAALAFYAYNKAMEARKTEK